MQPGLRRIEQFRLGAAEAVDALLGVADDERAAPAARITGRHLLQQWQQQAPLRGIGVLEFIEQQVVDLLIELVTHPVGAAVTLQQPVRRPFDLGEGQRAVACELAIEHRQRRHAQGVRSLIDFQRTRSRRRAPVFAEFVQHLLACEQEMFEFFAFKFFQHFFVIGDRVRRAFLCQQGFAQCLDLSVAAEFECGRQFFRLEPSRAADGVEITQQHCQPRIECLGVFEVGCRVFAELCQQLSVCIGHRIHLVLHPGAPVAAPLQEADDQRTQAVFTEAQLDEADKRQRRCRLRLAQDPLLQLTPRLRVQRAFLLDEREPRCDLGLERKTADQVLTERVQRGGTQRIRIE